MTKYLLNRLIRGLLSVILVVAIVMLLVYSLIDRENIFVSDGTFTKRSNNDRVIYKYQQWEKYGYLDYVPYSDYINSLVASGELTEEDKSTALNIGRTADKDAEMTQQYVQKFTQAYESKGYKIVRLDAVMLKTKTVNKVDTGGKQQLFAYKDKPVTNRLLKYFTSIIKVDNIHNVEEDIGERKLTFTLYDPIYNTDPAKKVFSPAIIGNGTNYKYLLYFDNIFPYVHQNLVTINLGMSTALTKGTDVYESMTVSQGAPVKANIIYPTGLAAESEDNLHSARYVAGSHDLSTLYSDRYTDDYTYVITNKQNHSKMGYSFIIGIISSILAYLIGIPVGIAMARRKDKLIDKIGTFYIVFILAVPSLAYIFMFKAIGGQIGLPTYFNLEVENWIMYILPVISLGLPSVASLMKWLRRYMIDQMNSDYVKFARSGGLSEKEIFSKHILKNAAIPIIQGIPGSILGALVGAIITERVYLVPGAGNLLTNAINKYDNGVIVGLTMFYAILSILSLIFGDILMAAADPRISFSSKAR